VDFSAPDIVALSVFVALLAGLFRGITGFGGALVMTPPLALLLGPLVTVPAALLLEGFAAAPMLWQTRREVNWRLVGPILVACSLTVSIGGYVLVTADPATIRRVIAAIVIFFSLVLMLGWRYKGRQRLATAVGLGAIAGALVGATSIGAPPVILYLLAGPDPVNVTRANLTYYVGLSSLIALVMMGWRGILDAPVLVAALVLAPGYYGGVVVGSRLFSRFNDARFRQFGLAIMIIVSGGILLA
jgi:hypothetical protein